MTICHFNIKHKNMKIKKLIINNFRAFKHAEIDFDNSNYNFNCLIGKNDSGKSTILEALRLFFNYDGIADEYDYNGVIGFLNGMNLQKKTKYHPISVSVCFEGENEKLSPFIINGTLTVRKQFEIEPISSKYPYDYSIAVNKSFFDKGELSKNQLKQTKYLEHYRIPVQAKLQMEGEYIYIPISDIQPLSLSGLFSTLPKFKLLAADTPFETIQDEFTKMQFSKEIRNLIRKINKFDINGEGKMRFGISSVLFSDNNLMTPIKGKSIPLANRGDGIRFFAQSQLFRQLAEKENKRNLLLAFEEPETHLHPSAQIEMYNTIKALSENPNFQVIITTHSPYIVKELAKDKITPIVIIRDEENNVSTISKFEETLLSHDDYVSMNEINYIAFEEPSVEYHQELFAFLQGGKQTVDQVDNLFKKEYDWFQVDNKGKLVITNGSPIEKKHSLPYCVRNQIDHPTVDDTNDKIKHNAYLNNSHFNEKELIRKSIEIMRNAIMTLTK